MNNLAKWWMSKEFTHTNRPILFFFFLRNFVLEKTKYQKEDLWYRNMHSTIPPKYIVVNNSESDGY